MSVPLSLAVSFIITFVSIPGLSAVQANESGAKLYRHKYLFTQKKQATTNCIRIVATAMKALTLYRSCKAWKTANAPLDSAIARCEKGDGTFAYVFESFDECTAAKSDTDGGNAS